MSTLGSRLGVQLILVVLVCALSFDVARAGGNEDPGFHISGIEARLYYHESASLGEDDVASGRVALRNTTIGGGDAVSPSSALLVLVSIVGCFTCSTNDVLELAVQNEARNEQWSSSTRLSVYFTSMGQAVIPFLIHETGCESLILTAKIAGAASPPVGATVPFQCGE